MRKTLATFLLLLGSALTSAQTIKIPNEAEYQNGKTLCAANATIIGHEKGIHTPVPVDHKNPSKGYFDLYSWFQGEFDPKKPVVVYVTGGPGQPTHWGQPAFYDLPFNLLLVDQRGIGCSRPRTYKQYLDPKFYSSENVALDLEVLRKALKIKSWSLFAVSYGTIPATIYASKFPQVTRSLIMEGVAFDSEALWKFDRRKDLILKAFSSQVAIVQNRIRYIDQYGVPSSVFFNWAKDELLWNDGQTNLTRKLAALSDAKEFESFLSMLKQQYLGDAPAATNELFVMNEVPYYMLSCQELGLMNYATELKWTADGNVTPSYNRDMFHNCSSLQAFPTELYSAQKYPVKVPAFYFQGENDGATEVSGAKKHFAKVAKGRKQFFLMKEGGHNPNLQILRMDNVGQQQILMKAITGNLSSGELMKEANSELDQNLKWVELK